MTSIQFILNDKSVDTDASPTMVLLDFIRERQGLKGTTSACREGDCGACSVMLGELKDGDLKYRTITSCLLPLGDVHGLHVVTVEGINQEVLTPVQQAISDCGGTQCGFCTPGFVVSLTNFLHRESDLTLEKGRENISGNICRCTGYRSIERAVEKMCQDFGGRILGATNRLEELVKIKVLPEYFLTIASRLNSIPKAGYQTKDGAVAVGGGTDLYVQKHDAMLKASPAFVIRDESLREMKLGEKELVLGAAVSMEDMNSNSTLRGIFPALPDAFKLIASLPIREQATIGGNLINASPIGDLTNIFLALNADIVLGVGGAERRMPLKNFYLGYKKLDRKPEEILRRIIVPVPAKSARFNFEKVSKRTHLDIASVNSGCLIDIKDGVVVSASISAGGVGPIPMLLQKTSAGLCGRKPSSAAAIEAAKTAMSEIAPISDARGAAEYKKLLLKQLIYAHFLNLFPSEVSFSDLKAA